MNIFSPMPQAVRRQAARCLVPAVAALAVSAPFPGSALAQALQPTDVRIVRGTDQFSSARQYTVAFRLAAPRGLRATHLEFGVGQLLSETDSRTFVSVGPVWRLTDQRASRFLALGFSPTLFSGSSIAGRELGGTIHFTSSAEFGLNLGDRQRLRLSLRFQHTSNGGLSRVNPGLDMIGLSFTYDVRRR